LTGGSAIGRRNACIAGLFAGIGGLESGFAAAGGHAELLCEWDAHAQAVLRTRFVGTELHGDVRNLRSLPSAVDTILAGFPCQDLSQAGRTRGIEGKRSSLVGEVFRLARSKRVRHVVLENVPFMLRLDRGRAMSVLTGELEALGFHWAYRVLDSLGFGVAQRRRRVFVIASRELEVARLFFPPDATCGVPHRPSAFGFYWTEGNTGLGWAEDAVPALKCGSGFGIPSPPAIWIPRRGIFTPTIEDAERLQGFPQGWTGSLVHKGANRRRWALVGNAVTVPVARWVGQRLFAKGGDLPESDAIVAGDPWPGAAFGGPSKPPRSVSCSERPLANVVTLQTCFEPSVRLSERATRGFYQRLAKSRLRRPEAFDRDLVRHIERMSRLKAAQESRASRGLRT
jgi:DNA (cytosine-5)-methyltransferase 1